MNRLIESTIITGTDVSSEVSFTRNNERLEVSSLILEGAYTNTAFTLQAKYGTTWYDVYDAFGVKVSITVASGKHTLPFDSFKDVTAVRVKGASNEASDRIVKFVLADYIND